MEGRIKKCLRVAFPETDHNEPGSSRICRVHGIAKGRESWYSSRKTREDIVFVSEAERLPA